MFFQQVLWDVMHPQRMMESADEAFRNVGTLTKVM